MQLRPGFGPAFKQATAKVISAIIIWTTSRTKNRKVRKFLFDGIAKKYLNWRGIKMLASTKYGFKIECSSDDLIQERLIYFGVWEPNLSEFFVQNLKRGGVFLDVGANVGYFSFLAAGLVGPEGEVHAIEASKTIYDAFNRNISLNKAQNIFTYNIAASNIEGIIHLSAIDNANTGATSAVLINSPSDALEAVRAVRLSNELSPSLLKRIDIIKIDVEGMEVLVLDDILDNIDKFKEDLIVACEITPQGFIALGRSLEETIGKILAAGFSMYNIKVDYEIERYLQRLETPAGPELYVGIPDKQMDFIFIRRKEK